MLARIWRTSVHPDRADEYEEFARSVSLPMFESQQGCLGVIMCRDQARCAVISLWADAESVKALEQSSSYRATVERLLSTGILHAEQSVEVARIHLASLALGKL